MQKVQAVVCCPRISNLRAPAIAWGYSPCLLKNSCGVQSTTEKIETSTARAEPLPQPTAGKGGWDGRAKKRCSRVVHFETASDAVLLQPLFGKVSSRNVVFPSRAFSETPRHSKDSIAHNITLCNVFQLSCEEGASCGILPSHLRITRSSNLMGILPKSF